MVWQARLLLAFVCMNVLFPLVAAILQAASFTLDKFVLSIRSITYRTYVAGSYPIVFLATVVAAAFIRPTFPRALFTGWSLTLILVSAALWAATNLILYRALDDDRLGEIQMIDLLSTIPVILVSGLLFADERNIIVIALALVAASAVVWSHWRNHRLRMNAHTVTFCIWGLTVSPIGAAISKILLRSWNPVSLELVRSGLIALIITPVLRKDLKRMPGRAFLLLVATNVATTIAWILYYFSYQRLGVVYTTLIFAAQPLLVYLAAICVLRERPDTRKSVAFGIVLGSIAVAFAATRR